MKPTLPFFAGLSVALGLTAFGVAQAVAGNGPGGASGNTLPFAGMMQVQSHETTGTRAENTYRHESRNGERDSAYEDDDDAPRTRETVQTRAGWMTMPEVRAILEEVGYKVRKMETGRYRYEAKATDAEGNRLELKIDPLSGGIMEQRRD